MKGSDNGETYRTDFTWHGFRYVEWTCINFTSCVVGYDSIVGFRLHNDVERVGSFNSSRFLFNDLQKMFSNTLLNNLISGLQSDCPHRERFGYGGDVVASAEAFIHSFDMYPIYSNEVVNFALDARSNRGMTETAPYNGLDTSSMGGNSGPIDWQTVYLELQWLMYFYYGDRTILENHYQRSKDWIDFLISSSDNYLITQVKKNKSF